jgi:HAD superfamily hydrolase (TIGR01459 family)
MTPIAHRRPVLLRGLSEVAETFDHLLLDQWGVLHDGRTLFDEARAALVAMRQGGKKVLVLSNSGKRAEANAERLARMGLGRDAYDGMVTSGEASWRLMQRRDRPPFDQLGRRCLLATRGGDCSAVSGLALLIVTEVAEADFILMGGLDEAAADLALWRPRLIESAALGLPMICANPDFTMFTADGLAPGPGSIARLYEELGGAVTYVGKPHAPIYEECLSILGNPKPRRVLAIGDSLHHDVSGGARMGMCTALVTSGIHREAFACGASQTALVEIAETLASDSDAGPDWLLTSLSW